MQLKRLPTAYKWFVTALLLLGIFIIFTLIFSTGRMLYPALYIEQWLLHRPLARVDCVFTEWKNLGMIGFSLFFTLVLGAVCLLLGYRWRVLPLLFLLLLLGVGAEYTSKQNFPQVIPINTQFGLNALACPQRVRESRAEKIMVAFGMWWKARPVRPLSVVNEQYSASAPFIFDDNAVVVYGYPSGHAMRWSFLGIIASWLAWRHVKMRALRVLVMTLALVTAFGGGFLQFYIGVHLATDLISGYLLGVSLACCAIGLLLLNQPNKRKRPAPTAIAQPQAEQLSAKNL